MKFSLHDADKAVSAVTRMLDDSSSLPGQLVRVLHGTFVAIDFALSDEEGDCTGTYKYNIHTYIHSLLSYILTLKHFVMHGNA